MNRYVVHIDDFGPTVLTLSVEKREGLDWWVAEAGTEGRLMLEGAHVFQRQADAQEVLGNELRIRAARAGLSVEEYVPMLLAEHAARPAQARRFIERTEKPLRR